MEAYLHKRPGDLYHASISLLAVRPAPRTLPSRDVAVSFTAQRNKSDIRPRVVVRGPLSGPVRSCACRPRVERGSPAPAARCTARACWMVPSIDTNVMKM